ncbi:hypothetical protein CRG98_011398 [Punica granatum]|uniref:Uncharacterized protein n=1 Tax=Punica granatum TaxID=22663 RepID=A0A2I0KIC1_PUNGR|nr:hypothetical protein CRG98_011398 [Punica granatum]
MASVQRRVQGRSLEEGRAAKHEMEEAPSIARHSTLYHQPGLMRTPPPTLLSWRRQSRCLPPCPALARSIIDSALAATIDLSPTIVDSSPRPWPQLRRSSLLAPLHARPTMKNRFPTTRL